MWMQIYVRLFNVRKIDSSDKIDSSLKAFLYL